MKVNILTLLSERIVDKNSIPCVRISNTKTGRNKRLSFSFRCFKRVVSRISMFHQAADSFIFVCSYAL